MDIGLGKWITKRNTLLLFGLMSLAVFIYGFSLAKVCDGTMARFDGYCSGLFTQFVIGISISLPATFFAFILYFLRAEIFRPWALFSMFWMKMVSGNF